PKTGKVSPYGSGVKQLMAFTWMPKNRVLIADRDSNLGIFDILTGKLLARRRVSGSEHGNMEPRLLAVSPDGEHFATCDTHTLALFGWSQKARILPTGGSVVAMQFAPDGTLWATTNDGRILHWSAGGKRLGEIVAHSGSVAGFALSPNGKRIASSGADGWLKLWDAQNAKILATVALFAGGKGTEYIVVRPNGSYTASSGANEFARWRKPGSLLTEALRPIEVQPNSTQ
ncbi:MAG TPA: WD40 repeat domain-containing protein, partial [Abditibacteriaceae bacterium]